MEYSTTYICEVNGLEVELTIDFLVAPSDEEPPIIFSNFCLYINDGEHLIDFDLYDDLDPIVILLKHLGVYTAIVDQVNDTPDPIDFDD